MKDVTLAIRTRRLPDSPRVAPTEVSADEEASRPGHSPVRRYCFRPKVDEAEPNDDDDRPYEVERRRRLGLRAGVDRIANEIEVAVKTFEVIHG
jgi:hypothetical protein